MCIDHEAMLGVKKADARSEVLQRGKSKKAKAKEIKEETLAEEEDNTD